MKWYGRFSTLECSITPYERMNVMTDGMGLGSGSRGTGQNATFGKGWEGWILLFWIWSQYPRLATYATLFFAAPMHGFGIQSGKHRRTDEDTWDD